ncbi:putative G-protein coupled receptor [Hymenopellis radicata]|nr:putative G-protein coupled receptor [Hymenopellis radicata]
MATSLSSSELRQRRQRSPSAPQVAHGSRIAACRPLPYSLEALDLSHSSPTQALASLRFLVLSYLAEVEQKISQMESPDFESWKVKGEVAMEDANKWVSDTLELLESIRADVSSHLPDFSVENFKARLPDLPDVPSIQDMRSHLPDMRSHLPDIPDMHLLDFNLSEMRAKLEVIRTRFHDLDFDRPIDYVPQLLDHLQRLHSHLTSSESPSGFDIAASALSSKLASFLDSILSSELVSDMLHSAPHIQEGEQVIEKAAMEVAKAIKHSFEGCRLIQYSDLPEKWRNNPFVTQGYRFIPIERWPLLVLSLFALHNETLNIHTHLIPFLLWGIHSIPFFNFYLPVISIPQNAYSCTVYHTMAGCAHHGSMEFCARVDYVGIGWLISASVGTVVYYGFRCHANLGNAFLSLCFVTGLAGNIFPFMDWFNQYEHRGWRIVFFLTLAFSSLAPLLTLAYLQSPIQALQFISPVIPSLISYIAGLVFYASHAPERFLSDKWCKRLDTIGVGSHSIWHCFIVLAVSQHRSAIKIMREHALTCS